MKPTTNWIDYYPIEPATLLLLTSTWYIHYEEECMRFHDLILITRKNLVVRKCMNNLLNRAAVFKNDMIVYN